jgi:hypothetical protein
MELRVQVALRQLARQQRVALEDAGVRLRQHHLDVVDQRVEERPVARHFRQRLDAMLLQRALQRGARRRTTR